MAKCHRNNVDSLVVNRIPSTTGNTFSRSSFRRMIFDAISCGGSSRHRRDLREEDDGDDKDQTFYTKTTIVSKSTSEGFEMMKSEKLCDLLNLPEMKTDVEETKKKKEETLEILKRVVKNLQAEEGDGGDKKTTAASEVRLLAKDDTEARVTLAMLGAIPPLVKMIDDGDDSSSEDSQVASLYALLNLGIGNDANKEAIVKAGAVHKMMKLIESLKPLSQAISEAIVANFLGLSALDSNKPIIGSSGAIIFLAKTLRNLEETSSSQAREDAFRALYNLSIHQQNVSFILETDLIPFMLSTLGDMEVSERILAILANVVSVSEGRKAIGAAVESFSILVDVLNWNDSQKCQEKALYILMLMAHKGYTERKAMIEAGIESSLLELTLVGSALVQKRASRILECLRVVDKGKQVSAPIFGISSSSSSSSLGRERDEIRMSDEKKAVKQLVQQSLQSNMKRIVKRANLQQDFVTSQHFTKSLTF